MTTESASAFGVADAVRIAREAHEGQVDKAGRPYIGHVLRVMKRLDTDEEQMAAALHDVIEDTDATPDSLLALGVPKVVVEAVQSLTKREGETYAELEAKPDRLLDKYTKAIEALGGTEEVAKWWAETP
jgi:(p)ppGpp synthase/HD superfamily hydrolase